jgi:hypothetical protein
MSALTIVPIAVRPKEARRDCRPTMKTFPKQRRIYRNGRFVTKSKDVPIIRSRRRTIEAIKRTVALHYDLTVREMLSACNEPRLTVPRHVAIWLSRRITSASYPEIIRCFQRKDHGTAMNSYRAVEARREVLPRFRAETNHLLVECVKAKNA